MTLVSLQAAAVQQGGGQRASRKRRREPSEQAEQKARRPLRASRQEAAGSADDAQAAGTQPAAAAAPTTTCIQPDKAAALRRAAQAAAKLAEAERRRGELLEAYQAFQEQATQRLMVMEVDAGKLSPRQLEGRTVRVYWPGDDAWYLAQVKAYCKDTGKHKLHYADGERLEELLALERVRLLVHAGEVLPLASGASLSATMGLLRRLLQSAECARDPARKNLLQQRMTELTAHAKQRYGEEVQEEELLRSATLASRSRLGPTATAHTSARSGDRGCGGRSSCGGIGGTAAVQRALTLAAQERSSDRAHQVQQGQHAQRRAPELRRPLKGQTQQPGIKQQGIEQQGMEQQQPEAVEPLVAADYAEAGEEEEEVAEHEPAHQELPLAKDAGADAKLKHGEPDADQEAELPAAGAAGGAALGDQLAPAVASCPAAPARAAMAALPSEGGQEGAAAAAAGREPAPARRLQVGEVGWFQVRGYPHWPFLVITPEEALARGLPAKHLKNPAFLPVQYFGTAEVSGVNPLAVEKGASKKRAGAAPCFGPFLDGVERGWHVPMQCNKANQFRVALAELETYFKEGNLPPSMVSKNNTDGEAEDEEQLDAEAEPGPAPKQAAKRRKSQAKTGRTAGADDSSGPLDLPLQLNKMLAVVALGKVEWLHPAFHNEKAIFPPGYRAERLARTPASGGEEVLHVMEVCRAPNGSGPLFRVTPQGCPPVEGPTATKAWQALYVSDEAGAARSLNLSGELMFGLSHPRVQRAIRALPNAQRCERYCGWPEGQQPEPVPLSPKEQRERLACEARMQHLPEGIQPQPGPERQPGICHVCDEEEETDVNLVMQCNGCNLFVHMNCYGVEEPPNGRLWLCDVCALGLSAPPPCVLCPVMGGALRRTTCGRWAHVACCDYVPETHLDPDKGTINGVAQVHRSRFQLTCQVCKQRHGACTQCCDPRCYQGFHPLCARRAGHRMERVEDSDGEDDECEEDEVEAAQQPSTSQAPSLPTGRDGSCDENDASAPNGNSKRPGRRGRGRASGAGKSRRGQHQEGVVLDDGSRLLAFCRKHSQTASAAAGMLPLGHPQQQSTGAAAAADAAPRASLPLSGGDAQLAAQQAGQQVQQAAAGPAPPPPPMSHPWGSARAAPFHPAARRGSRAPEAAAAAEAKRGYVLSQPYLVGGTLRHELVLSSSREQWRPADAPPSARRLLPPGAVQGQVHSLALPDAQAANADLSAQERQQQGAAPPPPGAQQEQQADGGAASTPRPPPLVTPRRAASGLGSPPSGVPQLAASPKARCKSDAERYREMVATQGQRVTIGKSGIHGWGAFAKTRHPAHTMVIEYVGELVRESVVTEVREKRWYNDMVGAGTYVFRLGGDSALCVDATRAGNLAHMLNHSCQPNCYSRTIRFVENGRGVDRVIIFARRDVEPWEELTYDYRFGGDEKLPCNCGAPSCRGYVNEKSSSSGQVWAPRSQLRPFNPPKSGLGPAAAESAPAVRPPMAAQRGDLQLCVAAQQPAAVASPPAAQDQQPAVLEQHMAAQQPAPMDVEPAPAGMQQAQFDVQQETQQMARSQPRQEAAAAAPAAQHYQPEGRLLPSVVAAEQDAASLQKQQEQLVQATQVQLLLPQPAPDQEVQQQQQQQPHAAEAAAMFVHTQQQQQQQQWMPQEAYEQRRCAAQLPVAQHPTAATAEEVLMKQLQQPRRSALPVQERLTTLAGRQGLPPPLLWPQSLQ